ncbi:hypothetical protein EC844_10940 [Acinetobacter calcoaceticus]|uniref:Uncharacterized protein n=1 Tax=Acinetobacter calcoaceticus TaxID=471 RepID=A0A4R1XVU0_ACICA|nr:hypothetical protein EC844_10940 [Acinetobacter calcoaceticus]
MKTSPPVSILSKIIGQSLLWGKPFLDTAHQYSTLAFQQHDIILPRVEEKYYSWTHYGIFFPALPEPHRYLNIMLLLGTPSALAFDHDDMITQHPRQTATLFSSTAAVKQPLLKAYLIPKDTQIQEDGQHLQFGTELTIHGEFPNIQVRGEYAELKFDFQLKISDQVSWFLKTPVYDHFSLLAQYQGQIESNGQRFDNQGLCTYEYARAVGLHSVVKMPIEDQYKIPLDFFTYQIINLDDNTQILLTKVDLLNKPAITTLHIRHLNQGTEVYQNLKFKVIAHHLDDFVAPNGDKMRLPKIFTWQAFDINGHEFFEIYANVDSPFHYGHGRGYVSSYRFSGKYLDEDISGRGYMEYINIEDQNSFIDDEEIMLNQSIAD